MTPLAAPIQATNRRTLTSIPNAVCSPKHSAATPGRAYTARLNCQKGLSHWSTKSDLVRAVPELRAHVAFGHPVPAPHDIEIESEQIEDTAEGMIDHLRQILRLAIERRDRRIDNGSSLGHGRHATNM